MVFDEPALLVLAPLLFVVGTIYVLAPTLPIAKSWARWFVFAAVWLVTARYLNWRIFETVLPASGEWYEVGWVWLCLAVELFALFDAMILYLCFLRSTDRRAEADAHEARLRATPVSEFPPVDVYIATYSEPLDVLEKTITGARCLDYPNFTVWVLDDGRRPWLKEYCEEKGVGYITRPDNHHAKAGNINHALTKTSGEFVALFDADFIVQRNFLMRTMGFFVDPKIGIVQIPHTFYNPDPMQTNLAVRKAIPDDQRFFFEALMPSRDGWDAAFCCGSNSVTRRAALRAVGDGLPVDSLTEDMLLSLTMLRQGYVTRYLNEPLAYGLAPEGLRAFFIQRNRWARGAMQILYLRSGPLGAGLSLMQRLLFLPTHWLSQSLSMIFGIMAPIVFLWSGVMPMVNVTSEAVVSYLVPMVLAIVGGVCVYAPGKYFPLATQVLGLFQSFRILPTALLTLFKPFGHGFKVTPKGGAVGNAGYDREVFWTSMSLIAMTAIGIVVNLMPESRIIDETALIPVVAAWSVYNVLILFIVCMLSLQGTVRRGEERFASDEAVMVIEPASRGAWGRLTDMSLSGAGIAIEPDKRGALEAGTPLTLFVPEVGMLAGKLARTAGNKIAVAFDPVAGVERDLLIRKLFTIRRAEVMEKPPTAWSVTFQILKSIWQTPSAARLEIDEVEGTPSQPVAKLPASSLVVQPLSHPVVLGQVVDRIKIPA